MNATPEVFTKRHARKLGIEQPSPEVPTLNSPLRNRERGQ
jgi:hypothetical protein